METTVAMLVPDETADETDVIADFTLEMPTVTVERDDDVSNQMLFSVETCAEVEPVVVFDWAVDSRVASEVVLDRPVLNDVAADRAAL